MEAPTIVKRTKRYLLIKIPLEEKVGVVDFSPKKAKLTPAEQRVMKLIEQGEQEYREGKTIAAASVDEALKIYGNRKRPTRRVHN